MAHPFPDYPELEGVVWRPAQKADAAAIVALQDACYDTDGGWREVESEILDRWESEYCDPERDSLVAVDPDGNVVCSVWSYVSPTAATKWRAFDDTHIHPDRRTSELRDFALVWWEARSLQRFAEKDDDLVRWLWRGLYDWRTDEIEFLESRDYVPMRYYDELSRDLSDPIPTRPLPDGLTVETWETADLDKSLAVHNASFADHWGSQPITEKSWAHGANEFHLPAASYVAYDDGEPVGYLMAAAFPHDFVDKGRREAWVEGLGTVRSHRKRGLASALVTLAMEEFVNSGMEFAVLGVDSENPTGAYHIYEELGFVHDRRNIAFIKVVG